MTTTLQVPVADGELVADLSGSGEPVVWLHGFSLDRRMWWPQVRALEDRFRCIRYDLRGFGESTLPVGPYRHPEDLGVLLDALDLASVHLVGLSRGGGEAIDFALAYPERVRSLTLVDSTLSGYDWSAPDPTVADPFQIGRTQGVEAARAAWLNDPLFAPARRNPRSRPVVEAIIGEYSGWHFVNSDPVVWPERHQEAAARLHELGVPALVLVGEWDEPDFLRIARRLAAGIEGARYEVISGAGHMANLEQPEAVSAAIDRFLRSPS